MIVDDEPLALDIMEDYIRKMPNLELAAKFDNAIDANQYLFDHGDIDLIFLDIQMPQMTGVEFIKSLNNPPDIIFTTAFSEYAIEGFNLNVVDYLLKPISFERFMRAVNKAIERNKNNHPRGISNGDQAQYFFVKANKKLIKIAFDDILYIEGLKDYVIIKRESGRIVTLQTMKSLESKLPTSHFRRIHRSYIVNITKIKALDGNTLEIHEKEGTKLLPIGKNYREKLLKQINDMKL